MQPANAGKTILLEGQIHPARQEAAIAAQAFIVKEQMYVTLAPGVELILLRAPAGEFCMGSDPDKDPQARANEQPQHIICLDEYWIGKTLVTNAQYAAYMQSTKAPAPDGWNGAAPPAGEEQRPVVNVSWNDAVAFCRWAAQVSGQKLRLPSEAEWEKAARGVDGRIYPWGDAAPDAQRCNFGMNVKSTTPVGQYSPQGDSPYGCADMAGNVWEWVNDGDDAQSYSQSPARNPSGPDSGQYRVQRGGSWNNEARVLRSTLRAATVPGSRSDYLGFRCAANCCLD